jgi:HD-GYP domain-containing protein (c-di-GMP phosphodiesterase class II)
MRHGEARIQVDRRAIMLDGGGYPRVQFPRQAHFASKIVHVCDVYDALRTNRPYREAWHAEKVLDYIDEKAGTEFDPEIARAFIRMMRLWERRLAVLESPDDAVKASGPAHSAAATSTATSAAATSSSRKASCSSTSSA